MAGKVVTPAPVAGLYTNTGGGGTQSSGLGPSELNDFRISAVIDRLSINMRVRVRNEPTEFLNLCLSLSRGIDFAIANNQIPSRSCDLPALVKQVCQNKNDTLVQAAIMVLMISVKSACQNGWFSNGDSEELNNLAKEIASNFCSVSNFNTEPNSSLSVISTIMSRFYPRLKMGHIFVFLEVKPGFDAYVSDFQISKNLKSSPGDKIRLFVVQTDNIETSSCLVTPAKVNFLLNGKGVERRTNIYLDTGPLIPTVVTHLLKYGSNLLQAVGEFNGNYIIAVAFMSEVPNPDSNTLQDYEEHALANVDADPEVIVDQSRISLNCPISFRRIKSPVKGRSCKHIQCFDFDNYVDINSRRPSWRCPKCNQHVCFSDIRIDQKMVKILKEVGPNVSDIIVSSDGSWNAVIESEDTEEKPEDKINAGQDECPQPADVLDLTQTDDAMDTVAADETEDSKQSSKAHELMTQITAINPHTANTNDVNQSSGRIENDFWAGIYISTFGLGSSNVQPSAQTAGVSVSSSVLTEAFTSPSGEVEGFHHNVVTTSAPQTGTSFPNALQLQQHQFGNPSISNEYGRFPSVPRNVTRAPNAVQALPAQTPGSVLQRSSTSGVNSFIPNGLSSASQASAAVPNLTNRANSRQVSPISSSPMLQHSSVQQNSPFPSARPPHQNAGFLDPNQVPNMHRVSNEHHSSSQQMANFRMPQAMSQSPGMVQSSMQSSGSFSRPQIHAGLAQDRSAHGTGVASAQQSHLIAAANRAVQMSVDTPRAAPSYSWNPDGRSMPTPLVDQRGIRGAISQPATRTNAHDPADLNWRPTGRMRGALSGQAYTDAYNKFMNHPTQQAQAARPISNMTSLPTNVRPQLQALMAGGVVQGIPAPNYASAVHVGRPVGSDVLPNCTSGTH